MHVPRSRLVILAAAIGLTVAVYVVLAVLRPDRPVSLLVFLPAVAILADRFGVWAGSFTVLLAVLATTLYDLLVRPKPHTSLYLISEEEVVLFAVGLMVVWLIEGRRRSNDAFLNSVHRFSSLVQNISEAAFMFDRALRVTAVNAAACEIFQRPLEQLQGRTLASIRQLLPFTQEGRSGLPVEAAVIEGRAARIEGDVSDLAHHRRLHVVASVTPLRDTQGHPMGALVLLTDITGAIEMQQRTLANTRHLAVGQMTAGLAHDFNHILDVIRRSVSVLELKSDVAPSERRKYTDIIDRAAVHGAEIVRGMRDYLAGGVGEMTVVDLAQITREAVALTRPLWRSRPDVVLSCYAGPVPPVHGQAADLRRVVVNLIINAIESLGTEGGRVDVHTEASNGSAICWVEDNGSGIAAELQSRIFQPYVSSKPNGLGMGLFSAQKIVLAHGGNLTFFSEPAGHTRFVIHLPTIVSTEKAA